MLSLINRDIEVSEELKKLGFSKISIPIQGKNLAVYYNGSTVLSSFDKAGWFYDACSADLVKLGLADDEVSLQ